MMDKIYDVKDLHVSKEAISFELEGQEISVPLAQCGSPLLVEAKLEYLAIFELDEDGMGIYWPVLDEDVSIAGLLRSAGREDLVVDPVPSLYWDDSLDGQRQPSFGFGITMH
ncbi:MAG: DUF2442 domain-containing protein [Anaerolineae bacterium]|nr:DUF2442 domain-containing protein [Anaerolineae bacterium]